MYAREQRSKVLKESMLLFLLLLAQLELSVQNVWEQKMFLIKQKMFTNKEIARTKEIKAPIGTEMPLSKIKKS